MQNAINIIHHIIPLFLSDKEQKTIPKAHFFARNDGKENKVFE